MVTSASNSRLLAPVSFFAAFLKVAIFCFDKVGMFLVMMYETWAYRIHKFSDGIQEKFGGLFVASYLSWQSLARPGGVSTSTGIDNIDNYSVTSLLLDPGNPSTIFAGTWNGVLRSKDGGETWQAVGNELHGVIINAMAVDPFDFSQIYAATSGLGIFKLNTAPVDSDTDGIPDTFETSHGLNPNDRNDAAVDSDGDGLTNLEEFQHGTDPFNVDTDGDGVNDGTEISAGTNPLDPKDKPVQSAQCSDNTDNDNDGKIDSADPGCHSDSNAANPISYLPDRDQELETNPAILIMTKT